MTKGEYVKRVNNNYGHGNHSRPSCFKRNFQSRYNTKRALDPKLKASRAKQSKLVRLAKRA